MCTNYEAILIKLFVVIGTYLVFSLIALNKIHQQLYICKYKE